MYLCFQANYTIEQRGSQSVKATTSGGERTKISLAFTANAHGTKLPILIVLPRKKPLKDFICPENVVIIYKSKSKTFDTQVMKDGFIERILVPHMLSSGKRRLLLHLDNSPVHKRSDLIEKCRNCKVKFENN